MCGHLYLPAPAPIRPEPFQPAPPSTAVLFPWLLLDHSNSSLRRSLNGTACEPSSWDSSVILLSPQVFTVIVPITIFNCTLLWKFICCLSLTLSCILFPCILGTWQSSHLISWVIDRMNKWMVEWMNSSGLYQVVPFKTAVIQRSLTYKNNNFKFGPNIYHMGNLPSLMYDEFML